jgi:glycosyltransferase involved in cell wall biosynthesis
MNGKKSLLWVNYGSLRSTLSSVARVSPASQLISLGWSVTIAAEDLPSDRTFPFRFYQVRKPRYYLFGYIWFYFCISVYVLKNFPHYDVVFFQQHSAPALLFVRMLLRLVGKKRPVFIMDVRSIPMMARSTREKAWTPFFEYSHKLANRFADGITAISDLIVESADINRAKLLGIWPSGVDSHDFELCLTQRSWPVKDELVRFIYIGALHEDRHLMQFCQAVLLANEKGYPVQLSLIGRGTFELVLADFAKKSGMGRITVLPPVPHSQIPDLMAGYHVGILPFPDDLKFRVSSPIKLFEYMASGIPVLATRIACHEAVIKEDFVFWAENAEPQGLSAAIENVFERKSELKILGSKARQASVNWTWEKSAQKLSQALDKALKGSPNA